jgi:4-amino-4-deoxy-L-arabinose transferase-like glycosyltransferase
MRIIKVLKANLPLILIIALGAILRLWGVASDWPLSSTVGDEVNILAGSLRMINEKSIIPHSSYTVYFPLMYYIHVLVFAVVSASLFIFGVINSLAGLKELVILNLGHWLIMSRVISVVLGTASIYLIYSIASKLFKRKSTAYWAALLLAISPLSVTLSHFGKIWTPQVFFMLLAFNVFLYYFKDNNRQLNWKGSLVSIFLIIISFSVNLLGILAYPLFLLVVFTYYCRCNLKTFIVFIKSRISILSHFILLIGIGIILFLSSDQIRFYFDVFKTFFTNRTSAAPSLDLIWQVSPLFRVGLYLNILLQFETILLILLPLSLWLIFKKNKQHFCFLLLAFLLFFVALGPPLMSSTRNRYLVLLVPFIVLPVAYLLDAFFRKFERKKVVVVLALIVVLVPSLWININYSYLLQRGSTKLSIYNWISDNLEPDENILLVDLYLSQDLIPNYELISLVKEYSPDYYSSRLKYLDNLPNKMIGHGIYSNAFICQWPEEAISQIEFDYIAIAEASSGVLHNPDQSYNFDFLHICDNMSIYKLNEEDLILREENEYFHNYTIEDGNPMSSYLALGQIKKLGKPLNIYKLK